MPSATSISNDATHCLPKYPPHLTSIIEITKPGNTRASSLSCSNPLIARGAFGHVDIAILVNWASDSSAPSEYSRSEIERPHESSAQNVQSVKFAAIKTIPNATIPSSSASRDTPSLTREAFAELNALRLLNGHENVTPLLEFYGARDAVASGSDGCGFGGWNWSDDSFSGRSSSLCLVFPYHPVDLADALNYRRLKSFGSGPPLHSFHLPQVAAQSIMHDIMSALKHLHEHHILHRDIKPGNLYVTNDGRIQLGDFGLAKAIPVFRQACKNGATGGDGHQIDGTNQSNFSVTNGLCTLQYRPPELLLGGTGIIREPVDEAEGINGALDIWSAGCIFAELLTLGGPLFPGQSVLDQLGRIFQLLGTPTENIWPGVSMLPDWNKVCFEVMLGTGLREKFVAGARWGNSVELITKMLSLDPLKRPSAPECLHHSWLRSFCDGCDHDQIWKEKVRHSVIDELVPSFLQIRNPIHFPPPEELKSAEDKNTGVSGIGDVQGGRICGNQSRDPFAYAKHIASQLASSRRSFPQSVCSIEISGAKNACGNCNEDVNGHIDRWKCSSKSNGLMRQLKRII